MVPQLLCLVLIGLLPVLVIVVASSTMYSALVVALTVVMAEGIGGMLTIMGIQVVREANRGEGT